MHCSFWDPKRTLDVSPSDSALPDRYNGRRNIRNIHLLRFDAVFVPWIVSLILDLIVDIYLRSIEIDAIVRPALAISRAV